jgi:hypothetical protein
MSLQPFRLWTEFVLHFHSMALCKDLKLASFLLTSFVIRVWSWVRPPRVFVFYLDPALGRKGEAVAYEFNQHGIPAQIASSLSRSTRLLLKSTSDLWVGLWNSVPVELLPKNYVFWNGEPTNHAAWNDKHDWEKDTDEAAPVRWHESALQRRNWEMAAQYSIAIWGYTPETCDFAVQAKKPFTWVPFGYSPYYEQVFGEMTGGHRPDQDIDVLFFGWMTARRKRLLDKLQESGVKCMFISQHHPVRGVELERLIARSKIILGIFGYEDTQTHVPDLARFDYILSNRLFLLHEKLSSAVHDPDFVANIPLFEYDCVVRECLHYLSNKELRDQRAQQAYEWFKESRALAKFIPFDEVRRLYRRRGILS